VYTRNINVTITRLFSLRVTRRCDNTVDKKRVNSCVLKHLFSEGVQQPKKSPKRTLKCCLRRATHVAFPNFAAAAAQNIYIYIFIRKRKNHEKRAVTTGTKARWLFLWSQQKDKIVLQSIAVHCSVLQLTRPTALLLWVAVCCSVLQYVAAEYSRFPGLVCRG